jgi:N-acyl-D-amino-acid deacylase
VLDLAIRGGRLVDGTGSVWFGGDVGIAGDRIVAVGQVPDPARRTIAADGLVVCPGFIDMHTHSDLQPLANPRHEMKLHQGVTLDVVGQDGLSLAPARRDTLADLRAMLVGWNGDPDLDWSWRSMDDYLRRFDGTTAVNVVALAGHGTLRLQTVGADDRPATANELGEMRRLLREAVEQGAAGLSAGLTYAPGMYADDDELVELCEVLQGTGAVYMPHHRNYGAHALEAYRDSIEIARRAGVPLHLAHCHLGFPQNRGRAPELLQMIDEARAAGVEVTLDTYPYLAGSTYLHAFLPGWAMAGGAEATIARLRDPALRERLRRELEEVGTDGHHGVPMDWSLVVTGGSSIADRAAAEGRRPIDVYCDLAADGGLARSATHHVGNEENVRAIMQHACHTGGSDGILVGDVPHPRGWGTFPRYLAVYVRELGLLGLEDAVRRFTSLPARILRLPDRGLLRPGMAADVTCFDPAGVRDTATYEAPRSLPDGIPHVTVNGEPVILDGVHTGATPGRGLRSGAATPARQRR